MPTDREFLKYQQAGALATSGAVDPVGEVGKANEFSISFDNVAGSPIAEIGQAITKACRVKRIRALPAANLATHASNYVTGTIYKRDGAGGSATSIGAFTTNSTGGAALAAFVPTTVSITAGTELLAAGAVLTYALVDAGTTTEVAVRVTVDLEYV